MFARNKCCSDLFKKSLLLQAIHEREIEAGLDEWIESARENTFDYYRIYRSM